MLPLLRGLPQPVRMYWVVPLFRSAGVASFLCAADAPGGGLASFRRRDLAVARAGGLRTCPAVQRLALSPARLFPCRRAAVLVSGRPPVSQSTALVTLASVALLDPGGRAKHGSLGLADVLRPRPLSLLPANPAAGGALRLGRSVGGRRPDVGARLPGFSRAPVRDRLPASVRSRARATSREHGAGARSTAGSRIRGSRSKLSTACRIPCRVIPSCIPASRSRARTPGFDLLRVPLVGRFLRWRHARLAMQVPLAALAGVLIFDGCAGRKSAR